MTDSMWAALAVFLVAYLVVCYVKLCMIVWDEITAEIAAEEDDRERFVIPTRRMPLFRWSPLSRPIGQKYYRAKR